LKEIFMTSAICEPMPNLMITAVEPAERAELMCSELAQGQLLRGQDSSLLERVGPLVLRQNVALDLASVDRIDAAGITALVALYRSARESGHRFGVTNVSRRVAQILSVVGLDRLLVSQNAVRNSRSGPQLRRSAA
jgi:anti-anti-sigma factor